MAIPRLVGIMGSGEISPSMVSTHRSILDRVGPGRAVMLDTPFGFQENAGELTARIVDFYATSLGVALDVASYRSAAAATPADESRAVAAVRRAGLVFAGPGSPSYALDQWRSTGIPLALRDKLTGGGAVVMASAAALTLGRFTVPVYEIYKVGAAPHWLSGLDVLAAAGLSVAVIPHFNNAEGGTHDTRYCYLGERRLRIMEEQLPAGTPILGIDEHTAVILDLGADVMEVTGKGVATIRVDGDSTMVEAGDEMPLERLRASTGGAVAGERDGGPARATGAVEASGPAALEARFRAALAEGSATRAVEALLHLEAGDTDRSVVRALIAELGEAAGAGLADPREAVAPFVEALLEQRAAARAAGRWDEADRIRDRLVTLGLEVRDGPDGTEWG